MMDYLFLYTKYKNKYIQSIYNLLGGYKLFKTI